ncbi:MAG: hypothetical protein U0401_04535 [Anaerolineae bacterium]
MPRSPWALTVEGGWQAEVAADNRSLTPDQSRRYQAELRRPVCIRRSGTGTLCPICAPQIQNQKSKIKNNDILILINDQNALYPLTIDPFIQQAQLTAVDEMANGYVRRQRGR